MRALKVAVQTFYNLQNISTPRLLPTKVIRRWANRTRLLQTQHDATRKKKHVQVRYGRITIIDATNYCHNPSLAMAIRPAWHHTGGLFPSSNHPVRTLHPSKDPLLYTARGSNNKQTYERERKKTNRNSTPCSLTVLSTVRVSIVFDGLLPSLPFFLTLV